MFIKPTSLSIKRKVLWTTLLILIILSLLFIFSHSTLSTEEVSAESGTVEEIIEEILPPDSPVTEEVTNNMDKVGHFGEFFILGVFCALFVGFFSLKRLPAVFSSMLFAQLVAFSDETLQMFTGRYADVVDMWFDVFGFAAASIVIYLLFWLAKGVKGIKER